MDPNIIDTLMVAASYNPIKYDIKEYRKTDGVEKISDDIAAGLKMYEKVYVGFKNRFALIRYLRIFEKFSHTSFSVGKNGAIVTGLDPKNLDD